MRPRRIVCGVFAVTIALATVPALAQERQATLGFEPNAVGQGNADLPPRDSGKVVAGVPVVQTGVNAPSAVLPRDDWFGESKPFWGRLSLRTDVGDGVGYLRGFTSLEGMIPIQQGSQSLLFADVRVVNFDQENRWEYNVGAGYRWYSPRLERILGVNSFYDSRKTDFHLYQQLGLGFEVLSPNLEFRTNGYFILGPAHRLIGDTGVVNLGVFNNNFVFQRLQTIEVARGGVEFELGGRLPILERFCPRAYGAFYSYSAEGTPTANGVRGRLEAQVTERASLHFAVQNDRVFHTTVTGGLAIHFGAPAYRSGTGRTSWEDVLRQRIHRDVNIVISQTTTTTTQTQPVPPPPPPPPPELPPENF